MTFTYLGDLTTDLDKVRFEIQDTVSTGALFTDEEINAKLSEFGSSILLTAAALCDVLATRYAADFTFKTDDQQFNRSDLSKQYAARAIELRERASGGISVAGFTRTDGYSNDISARDGEGSSSGRVRAGYTDPDLPD